LGRLPPGFELDGLKDIDLSGVVRYDGPSGACVSVIQGSERKLRSYNNQEGVRRLLFDHREEVVATLSRASVLHVTSLLAPGAAQAVAEILKEVSEARGDRIRITLDLGMPWATDRHAAEALLPYASTLLLAEEELQTLLPGSPDRLDRRAEVEAIDMLTREYQFEASSVVVLKRRAWAQTDSRQAGRRARVGGTMFYRDHRQPAVLQREEVLQEPLDEAQVVDSTGAGDFFAAGILAGLCSPRTEATQTLVLATSMARHKLGHGADTAFLGLEQIRFGVAIPASRGKVFVSHSHRDSEVVGRLVDLLRCGSNGSAPDEFFCSSQPETAVPFGGEIRQEVIANLRGARWIIFVVTPAFQESAACQREVGAAQVLGLPAVPLLPPAAPFNPPGFQFADSQSLHLDDSGGLRSLWAGFAAHFGWGPNAERWDERFTTLQEALKA
jgi:sugar/nucleoside kinase (ribokinase family)